MKKYSVITFHLILCFSVSHASQDVSQSSHAKDNADEWQLVAPPKSLKSVVFKALAHENAQSKNKQSKLEEAVRGLRGSLNEIAQASQENAQQLQIERKAHAAIQGNLETERKTHGDTQSELRFNKTKHKTFKQLMT